MLEKQPYPWKLKSEELPPSIKAGSSQCSVRPHKTTWFWLAGSLAGLSLLAMFLAWQTTLVQTAQDPIFTKASAENPSAFQVAPSPIRYTLWTQPTVASNEESILNKPESPISLSPTPEIPAVLFNNPQPEPTTIPVNLAGNISAQPETPTFALIGIAKGTDGIVATIKVKDGNTEEIKDIRQGAPLLPGYTVTQIADEYVLLKTSQEGKTLRVD
jgi:hypothetical protein